METKEVNGFVFSPTEEPDQLWILSKASGDAYRVDLKDFVCSCPDFKFRQAKGDRLCKHLKAACEAYAIEARPLLPVVAEGAVAAITISHEEVIQAISSELRDEMVKNYVYAVPDYEREYTDKQGKKKTSKKAGWIDLKATGVRDLTHMVADRYGAIEVGEFRFMDAGDKWVAWRDIKLGNFTTTGFADCSKDREFPYRYLGNIAMRNAYKAIVPKIYQDIFTNKFRELMRTQLKELLGPGGEAKLGKPIEQLTDGELAKELKEAQEARLRLKGAGKAPAKSSKEANWEDFWARAEQLGLSEERACEMLGVKSLEEWTGQGKTIKEAIEVISKKLSQQAKEAEAAPVQPEAAEAGPVTPATEAEVCGIDLNWLKETMDQLKWSEQTAITYLVSKYRVSGEGSLADVIGRLTKEQTETFVKELQTRVQRQPQLAL